MNEQEKNFKILKEDANQIFQEAFGNLFNKKLEEPKFLYKDDVVVVAPNHNIHFPNTGSLIIKPLPNYGVWTNIDWTNNNFSWMHSSDFEVKTAEIKGKGKGREVISFKDCIFGSGNFRGGKFIGGKFGGSSFVGQFGPGAKWLTTPFAFVDGTIKEGETFLGQKNINSFNQNIFDFNITRVVPGSKIVITMQNGIFHEIDVIKRLDVNNSNFQFKIKDGNTNKVFKLIVKWAYLRGNSKEDFENNTVFNNYQAPKLFVDKFNLQFNSPIAKVIITEGTSYEEEIVQKADNKKMSPEGLASHQESFDLINAPFFGISNIPSQPIYIAGKPGQYKNNIGKVFFNFRDNNQLNGYDNTVKNIENKILRADLNHLKSYLNNGIIDGAPSQYPYLASLIGPISKEKSNTNLDKNFNDSLARIESMLRDFVDAMVLRVRKKNGVHDISNDKIKQLAKDGIKQFLEIAPQAAIKKAPVAPKVGLKSKPAARLQEAVRDIISKNMKHF